MNLDFLPGFCLAWKLRCLLIMSTSSQALGDHCLEKSLSPERADLSLSQPLSLYSQTEDLELEFGPGLKPPCAGCGVQVPDGNYWMCDECQVNNLCVDCDVCRPCLEGLRRRSRSPAVVDSPTRPAPCDQCPARGALQCMRCPAWLCGSPNCAINHMIQYHPRVEGLGDAQAVGEVRVRGPGNYPPNTCRICGDYARVPFARCNFCGDAPSFHHGRCCPMKPRRPGPYASEMSVLCGCSYGLTGAEDLQTEAIKKFMMEFNLVDAKE